MTALRRSVFLHSTWRTGSTYLWSKFRAHADTCSFFEPLNEHLSDATPAFVDAFEPWSYANHPALDAPYLEEFRPLFQSGGGISGFPAELSYGRYRLDAFAEQPDLVAYFDRLDRHARTRGKVPVFGCVRTGLRVGWFKRHLAGAHIVIRRDPRRQFVSCLTQAINGNRYFLERALVILGANRDDPAFSPLRAIFDVPAFDGPDALRDAFYAEQAWSTPWHWLYALSYMLHRLAEQALLRAPADLVLDMDRISSDTSRRVMAEREIRALTGIEISLWDCAIERYDERLSRFEPQFAELEARADALLNPELPEQGDW